MTDEPTQEPLTGWNARRVLYLVMAGTFTALGALGAILPVLPTTPFLLLASYFLARSSPRLNEALLNSRFLGPVLRDWQKHHGIRPNVRIQALVTVIVVLTLTIAFASPSTTVSIAIGGLGLIGLIVILKLPAVRETNVQPDGESNE